MVAVGVAVGRGVYVGMKLDDTFTSPKHAKQQPGSRPYQFTV
jgi:hypothetical protein